MAGSTPNQETVTRYMDGFRHTDRDRILSCLTDDVEWQLPGMFHTRGKAEFATHIVDEGFTGKPAITVDTARRIRRRGGGRGLRADAEDRRQRHAAGVL